MSRQPKEPTWPFLCILACLFVLSAAAPKAWEKSIRTRDASPSEAISETDEVDQEGLVASLEISDEDVVLSAEVEQGLTIPLANEIPTFGPAVETPEGALMVAPSPRIASRVTDATSVEIELADPKPGLESLVVTPSYSPETDVFLSDQSTTFVSEQSESVPPLEPGFPLPSMTENAEAAEEATVAAPVIPDAAVLVEAPVSELTPDDTPTVEEPQQESTSEAIAIEETEPDELPEAIDLGFETAESAETPLSEATDDPSDDDRAETQESDPTTEATAEATLDDQDMSAVPGVSVLTADQVAELAAAGCVSQDPIDAHADWTVPVSILEELEPFCWDCETGPWAMEVADAVRSASTDLATNSTNQKESLTALLELGRAGVELAQKMKKTDQYDQLHHLLTTLHRRAVLWDQIANAAAQDATQTEPVDWNQLAEHIKQAETLTAGTENGAAWRTFLDLPTLLGIASRGAEGLTDDDLATVRLVLYKLQMKDVTEEQQTFLALPQLVDLRAALQIVATRPIDTASWVAWVEAFERTGSPSVGQRLALESLKLSLSDDPAQHTLADRIDEFYCGPNVRIAVTGYLLNRMLPDREPEYQWVRDTILGHPVRGRSRTSAEVGLALIPDSQKMRAALTVDGLVSASTSSTAGPATFFNDTDSEYSAIKELELTPEGIRFAPTKVTVDNRSQLRQIRTEYDGIPLISSIVQSVARSQHDMSRPAIRREMNRKVQHQAENQIDEEVDARLGELNDRLKRRLLDPLAEMSLRPEVAEAETTESRMSMQLNLAGPTQLGSNTPRPWAPSDSVLSFQVHESALNNVLLGLELDGATMTIKDLRECIANRFNRPELLEESTEHDDASITFAPTDAARIDFEEGRVAISLGIAQLRAGRRVWRNFRVRAYYRPVSSGQSAVLERDGVVELIGSMRMSSQIALRGIFSKTFARSRDLPIVPQEMAADPRLKGLEVTQLNLDDGWFALAIGPERLRPATASTPTAGTIK